MMAQKAVASFSIAQDGTYSMELSLGLDKNGKKLITNQFQLAELASIYLKLMARQNQADRKKYRKKRGGEVKS